MGTNTNNATVISQTSQRIGALQKHVASKAEIPIAGKKVKCAALVALFQGALAAREEVNSAHGAYRLALAAREEAEAQRKEAEESLRAWVIITYGADSSEAHDFGYTPKKPKAKTVETKARALLLNRATREARGTKGKKERLKIKGTLPNPPAPPPADTAPPAPPPALDGGAGTPAPAVVYVAPPTPALPANAARA